MGGVFYWRSLSLAFTSGNNILPCVNAELTCDEALPFFNSLDIDGLNRNRFTRHVRDLAAGVTDTQVVTPR